MPTPDLQQIDVLPWLGCREPFSSISHLLGAGVFAGLAVHLVRRGRGNWLRMTSLTVLAISSVVLLLLSGTYHLFWPGPTREFMLRADVAAVFLLIAGSMTPVHAILFTGLSRWGALACRDRRNLLANAVLREFARTGWNRVLSVVRLGKRDYRVRSLAPLWLGVRPTRRPGRARLYDWGNWVDAASPHSGPRFRRTS